MICNLGYKCNDPNVGKDDSSVKGYMGDIRYCRPKEKSSIFIRIILKKNTETISKSILWCQTNPKVFPLEVKSSEDYSALSYDKFKKKVGCPHTCLCVCLVIQNNEVFSWHRFVNQ